MADPDIPIAYAAPATAPIEMTKPAMTKGRSSRVGMPKQPSKQLSSNDITLLKQQGFSTGLAKAMTSNIAAFPLRIWVVDNSGSMNKADGHRIVESSGKQNVKLVPCTRWTELQQTVEYHIQMAALLEAPTVFRLLNDPGRSVGPQQFSVAEQGQENIQTDVVQATHVMVNVSPGGVTPLAAHVREIRDNVAALSPTLQANGTKVAIILATDGLPTDSHGVCSSYTKAEFQQALRSLEGLPVWVVIRLCTDEDDVVEYYNDLDSQLELSLEVLDDFVAEAKETYQHNPWLTYALPLHRCREMGYHNRLFDLLDERSLTAMEVRDFLRLLLGDAVMDYDPQADWKGFIEVVATLLNQESNQWNPISKKPTAWVDLKKLKRKYGKKGGCSIM